MVDLVETKRALVYRVVQSTTRAIYFPKKDTYASNGFSGWAKKTMQGALAEGEKASFEAPGACGSRPVCNTLEPGPNGWQMVCGMTSQWLVCGSLPAIGGVLELEGKMFATPSTCLDGISADSNPRACVFWPKKKENPLKQGALGV